MYPVSRRSPRLELRELTIDDVEAVLAIYGSPEATEHLSFDPCSRFVVAGQQGRGGTDEFAERGDLFRGTAAESGGDGGYGDRRATDPHRHRRAADPLDVQDSDTRALSAAVGQRDRDADPAVRPASCARTPRPGTAENTRAAADRGLRSCAALTTASASGGALGCSSAATGEGPRYGECCCRAAHVRQPGREFTLKTAVPPGDARTARRPASGARIPLP
ncbi:hypothetical protein B1H19_02435 [Streptomyces gilvosporeus]|uniref:Uncharacterized protein n=1 Tax=Streptomyces gilvosporeus TaxID=553510 RepID=A0A1V0TJS3_9ACTN|nr:hypothetical protein B1H19_02435 [Streptomyces gilvosporeus]